MDIIGLEERIKSGDVDFGRQAEAYKSRPSVPDTFFEKVAYAGCSLQGKTVLDVGTGPGICAFQMVRRFGARFCHGVDIAASSVEAAKSMCRADDPVSFTVGTAEATGLQDGSVDVVTCIQCWPWFDHQSALTEFHRVLRKTPAGGYLIIGQFSYLPLRCEVARETEKLMLKYNPSWDMYGFDGEYPGTIVTLDQSPLFDVVQTFSYDHKQPFTHDGWCTRIRSCNGVGSGGQLTDSQVDQFDQELRLLLRLIHPDPQMQLLHRVWGLVAKLKP